jgi:hypothetical protein
MKKLFLFALLAVAAMALSTLGGYEKSPPGDPVPYAYALDNHDIMATAISVDVQTASADYFLPEFIIEEFYPISAPLVTELDERWCSSSILDDSNKMTKPTRIRKSILNPPKLC